MRLSNISFARVLKGDAVIKISHKVNPRISHKQYVHSFSWCTILLCPRYAPKRKESKSVETRQYKQGLCLLCLHMYCESHVTYRLYH